jgi:HAD superfamily hydrolase (TIGR01509 family)
MILRAINWTDSVISLTHIVEDTLRAAELRAVETAMPTPGSRELMAAFKVRGRPVAIVSNNSAPAIATYITRHGLTDCIEHIIGREPYKPDLMKPNPEPVRRAIATLGAAPTTCLFVGDSQSDVAATRVIGIPIIAFVNSQSKMLELTRAGAEVVVTAIADIVAALP